MGRLALVMCLALALATSGAGCGGPPDERAPASPAAQLAPAPAASGIEAAPVPTGTEPGTEPGAEPHPQPEPERFTPATRDSGACEVTVRAVLEAVDYRGGGPMTPALAASLDADADFARMYAAESHGDHYIECVYEVALREQPGQRYRWRTWISNTSREHTPARCNALAAEVAEDILRTTQDCSDLDAGAYWGHVLEPL